MTRSAKATILVVDDTPENLQLLAGILKAEGYKVHAAPSARRALAGLQKNLPDLILLDVRMPGMDGFEVCETLKKNVGTRDIPVIFISALNDVVDKVQGFEAGGVDYITKPFQQEEVLARVKNHLLLHRLRSRLENMVEERTAGVQQANEELTHEITEHERTEKKLQQAFLELQQLKDRVQAENIYLREEIKLEHNFEEILGTSEELKYLLFKLEQVAKTTATVLIMGETGTGKELIARAIHSAGPRKDRPLVKVNCATLPANIIESELFGHEKGAFTGAVVRQIGRFEFADGATIFLDEIGELPLELQSKLLRVIQEGEFERLGNPRSIKVDVRIIAATNRDLEQEVQAGRFRQDLYYRLNLYPLSVPPLRDRPDDIPLLVQSFVRRFNKKLGKQVDTIPQAGMDALQKYTWPGNVRELENLVERAVIMTQDNTLRVELPEPQSIDRSIRKTLEEMEYEYILQALQETGWKIHGPDGAAELLGLNPSTLRGRMRKLHIQKPTF